MNFCLVGPIPLMQSLEPDPATRGHKSSTISDTAIDEWQTQISKDFDDIYDTLQLKQFDELTLNQDKVNKNLSPKQSEVTDNQLRHDFDSTKQQQFDLGIFRVTQQPFWINGFVYLFSIQTNHLFILQIFSASPHQYYDSEVNIHYRAPVQQLVKYDFLNEDELNKKQREQV